MTERAAITEADRVAAAAACVLVELRELILAGRADHHAEPWARHRQQARREALEESAKLCEERAAGFLSPQYAVGQPLSSIGERFACGECATSIRKLKGD